MLSQTLLWTLPIVHLETGRLSRADSTVPLLMVLNVRLALLELSVGWKRSFRGADVDKVTKPWSGCKNEPWL